MLGGGAKSLSSCSPLGMMAKLGQELPSCSVASPYRVTRVGVGTERRYKLSSRRIEPSEKPPRAGALMIGLVTCAFIHSIN